MSDIEERHENLLRFLGITECYRCSGTGRNCRRCRGEGFVRHGYRDPKVPANEPGKEYP